MSLLVGPDGRPLQSETPASAPEAPNVDLPPPDAAPADRPALPDERVAELLEHPHVLVRQFAVEQVAHRRWDDPSALTARLDDDPEVAILVARTLDALKHEASADAVASALATATGEPAASLAAALGTLAPERLLPAVKAKGRLDDEAFAGAVTALALTGTEDGRAYVDRALTRSNVVSPERRSATFSAALLSGDAKLAGRVLAQAIAESEREAPPEGASYPARAALAALAGGPPEFARSEAQAELWKASAETLDMEAPALLGPEAWSTVEAGLRARDADAVLAGLAPFTELEAPTVDEDDDDADDLGTMPARRQRLLAELVRQRAAIARLGPEASALFVAVAARAAAIVSFGQRDDADSPGTRAVAEALGGALSPQDLVRGPEAQLVDALSALGPRDVRTVLVALTRGRFRRASTIRRVARAAFDAGHGTALCAAAAESPDPRIHGAVVRAALARRAAAEATVVQVLEARPLENDAARFALLLAEQLRTERCALAVGRAFGALRDLDRGLLAQAVLRCGDDRLRPVIEAKAFPNEPEEAAWVVLSMLAGAEIEGRLEAALARTMGEGPPPPPLQVPLRCAHCGETLVYGFEHAYVDAKATQGDGDPAFAGDPSCKACGTRDQLQPTEETTQILTAHMMQFLSDMQAGRPGHPLVTPARTAVGGKEMGMAEALRTLTAEIDRSPDAIRPRLHRARLGLLLSRSTVREDLDKVFELDPTSLEARALEAQLLVRAERVQDAADRCAELVRELRDGPEPRLYDVDGPAELREGLEDLLLELSEEGAEKPSDVDLSGAEDRRTQRELAARAAAAPPPAND